MFRKKKLRVRNKLSVDALMLKTYLSKFYDLCYFMILHTQPFILCQPIYHLIRIKVIICQTDSIIFRNCELCQSWFSVLSVRLIIKLLKICFLFTYVDQMVIQQRFNVLLQLQFYNVFYNVLPLFWKVFTDILEIYELPKVYNKIPKYS